jgi:hypothetical protein
MMIVNKKNTGSYVAYQLTGAVLSFRHNELALDLPQYQCDYPVHLDISEDASGALVLGPSIRYIAEIDIPAREYIITAGEKDDIGFSLLYKAAVPFSAAKVSLTLWAVEV